MANPILVTGAAGRVGAVGRTVTELLLKQGKAVRAMARNEDGRAQALRNMGAEVDGCRVAKRWKRTSKIIFSRLLSFSARLKELTLLAHR